MDFWALIILATLPEAPVVQFARTGQILSRQDIRIPTIGLPRVTIVVRHKGNGMKTVNETMAHG